MSGSPVKATQGERRVLCSGYVAIHDGQALRYTLAETRQGCQAKIDHCDVIVYVDIVETAPPSEESP